MLYLSSFNMDEPWRYANKILFKAASATIYSTPPFVMETILSLIVCSIYIFLHLDLINLSVRTVQLRPNRVQVSSNVRHLVSNPSNTTSISCVKDHLFNVSDCNIRGSFISKQNVKVREAAKNVEEKIENVLKMTPDEYLKQQKQVNSKNEFHACLKSLSSLYEDCIKGEKSDRELQKQLQNAKDSLGEDAIKYLGKNAQYLTQSLFDLLEKMVMSSSLENPLPFKGDITTLVFDAGNLNVEEDRKSAKMEGKAKAKQS